MKIRPISEHLILKLEKRDEKTAGGIYLPDPGKEVVWGGLVHAINETEDRIKRGDIVFFNRYSDKKVIIDDEEFSVVKKKDVIAIIREGEILATKDMVIVNVHYEETVGAIIIPEYKGIRQYHAGFCGEVIALGPKYPYDVKKGDRVYFRRHEGKGFTYKDEDYMSLRERWVDGLFLKCEEVKRND